MIPVEVQHLVAGQRFRIPEHDEVFEVARVTLRSGRCIVSACSGRYPYALMEFAVGFEVGVL